MHALLLLLMVFGLLAVLAVLAMGVVGLFRGNSPERSNVLMRYRVVLQFGVVMLAALFLLFARR
jgi:hypothetical protein